MFPLIYLITLFCFAEAAPWTVTSRCVGTIASLGDVSDAVKCATVNINAFTVPAGQTFSLNLLQGTTVNVLGDVSFGNTSWAGPMFQVTGQDITFNGHGHTWDGGGTFYWDGLGAKGSTPKPDPMMAFDISGTVSNVRVVDSPTRAITITNPGPIVVSKVTVDNSRGNYPNDKSNGLPAGRNTDGFDVAGDDVVIEYRQEFIIVPVVKNQDDCLAINRGKNIVFRDNRCEDGHGISIGSISSHTTVEGVIIEGNTVLNSQQAFRIKTKQDATDSSVTNVTYSNNVAKNCTEFGVLITQSYPDALGTPGNGVKISNVNFYPETTDVEVAEAAKTVAVVCGSDTCLGTWNWSGLKVSGGKTGVIKNKSDITGIDLSGV